MDEVNSMAGDWIKMRPALLTSPKVNGIARFLEQDQRTGKRLLIVASGVMSDVVTRDVMRFITVATLLKIWGAANEHTDDGVFKNADLQDIDDIAGIPGFGEAMQSEGWAYYDAEANTVELPNFNEYNTVAGARGGKTPAQRQKEYRERKEAERIKSLQLALCDSDGNALHNGDAEKRREEKSNKDLKTPPTPKSKKPESASAEDFAIFWKLYPRKAAKKDAVKAWSKIKPALVPLIMKSLAEHCGCREWIKDDGQFIPYPASWLNGEKFNDEVKPYVAGQTNGQRTGSGRLSAVDQVRAENDAAEARRRTAGSAIEITGHLQESPSFDGDWEREFASIRDTDGKIVGDDGGIVRTQVDLILRNE